MTMINKDFILISLVALMIGGVLTWLTYAIGAVAGWITPENPSLLEASATVFNYACVVLCVMRHNANWWLGIVAVVLLGILFWQQGLYASMFLSLAFFLPIQVAGWFQWSKNLDIGYYVAVEKMDPETLAAIFLVVGPAIWGVIHVVNTYFGGVMSPWDSAILVLSVVAQILLNFRRVECWYFWCAVNVLSVYVYGTTGLYLVAFQYMIFLINAVNGWYQWRKVAV